jgi:serine/threonine protein phosphatase PrpC
MNRAFKTIAQTEVGLVRDGNEDAALVSNQLIAVADGMGGHAGGEIASKIAIITLRNLADLLSAPIIDSESREDLLLNVIFSIDQEISSTTLEYRELHGMGTTLTALHLGDETVELLHVGDSRCYLWRDKKLVQLSYDHTVLQELLDQGRLTREEVYDHPQRSLLTQALMGDSGIDPLLHVFDAKIGDRFLLCSDGLSSVLSDQEIAIIIKKNESENVVAALIEEVHRQGAPDNVTIVWSEIVLSENVGPAVIPTSTQQMIVLGAAL